MKKGYVLYNLKAGNKRTLEDVQQVKNFFEEELQFVDVLTVTDYKTFFATMKADDYLVICGGDGTLNHFVNDVVDIEYNNDVYYYPIGTGNDFANDLGKADAKEPFMITKYLRSLPKVTVNGKTQLFINGIGYGVDGYCCEVGDALKAKSDKPVNYTAIAIKGLLFHYKPTNAKVTVDGKEYNFKKVWIAPTMHGRFYGGGMIPTPNQDRLNTEGMVSTMLFYGSGKLKTLMVFPSIFKGEHVKHTKMVEVLQGREVTVEFDRPTALQIDGETVLNVTSYTVRSAKAD